MTTIKVRQNGSLLVEGDDVKLIDWNGNEYKPANPQKFALCRCGHSKNKPFCDSSHKEINFQASEAAPLPPELTAEQANQAPAPALRKTPTSSAEPPRDVQPGLRAASLLGAERHGRIEPRHAAGGR